MQDRPTYDELLAAVEHFLDMEIVPNVPGSKGFHARVAANAIRIVRRELANEDEQLAAEWAGLDRILGAEELPSGRREPREALLKRNQALCELIRGGSYDESAVLQHVKASIAAKLTVSDPELLERG